MQWRYAFSSFDRYPLPQITSFGESLLAMRCIWKIAWIPVGSPYLMTWVYNVKRSICIWRKTQKYAFYRSKLSFNHFKNNWISSQPAGIQTISSLKKSTLPSIYMRSKRKNDTVSIQRKHVVSLSRTHWMVQFNKVFAKTINVLLTTFFLQMKVTRKIIVEIATTILRI